MYLILVYLGLAFFAEVSIVLWVLVMLAMFVVSVYLVVGFADLIWRLVIRPQARVGPPLLISDEELTTSAALPAA